MTSIYVKEKAAQGTPTATYGQIWAENTVPASFHIEDDVGNPAAVTMGNITGTLVTAAQTNITSVGTLTSLSVTGAFSCGALTSTGIDDNATSEQLQIGDTRIDCGQPLFIAEAAAAETNVAGYGQIWVKSDTPSSFHFMADSGVYSNIDANGIYSGGAWGATSVGYIQSRSEIGGPGFQALVYSNTANHEPYLTFTHHGGTQSSKAVTPNNAWTGGLFMGGTDNGLTDRNSASIRTKCTDNTDTGLGGEIIFEAGNLGKMTLFDVGHLEVYGPDGDVTNAWSDGTADQTLHVKNNGNVAIKVTCLDGTAAYAGIVFSDSSADGDWLAGINAFAGAHSTRAGEMDIFSGSSGPISFTPANYCINMRNPTTVSGLPTGVTGYIARVTDASSPSVGSTVTGGSSSPALVWYNGSNWTVIGV